MRSSMLGFILGSMFGSMWGSTYGLMWGFIFGGGKNGLEHRGCHNSTGPSDVAAIDAAASVDVEAPGDLGHENASACIGSFVFL